MAKSEADHALRLVKGYKLSYPLYIDVEEASQSGIAKDVVKVFCEAVKAAGYMPGVYANENWWNNYLVGVDSYTKWVAKYGVNNGQPGNKPNVSNFDIWQYTSKGSCDGIGSSGLDMNICYRDFPAELGGSKPAPAPAEKSNEEIANEVLAGTWGNGDDRKNRLPPPAMITTRSRRSSIRKPHRRRSPTRKSRRKFWLESGEITHRERQSLKPLVTIMQPFRHL